MLSENRYRNRKEAGQKLAIELSEYKGKDVVVLAIPRGGVVLGYKVAKMLEAPMDIVVPRKIGAPGNPELALGAVAEDGTIILDQKLIDMFRIPDEYIQHEQEAELAEIKRRSQAYRKGVKSLNISKKLVILVDDGLATGATMKAAIASIKKKSPSQIIMAVPVAPPDTVRELRNKVDKIICPLVPEPFMAIGQFYVEFGQTSDDEVLRLIELAQKWRKQ